MRRSSSRVAVTLLIVLLGAAVPTPTGAIRVDHDHDFDFDEDHPLDLDQGGDEDEDEDGGAIDLDLGPGRLLKKVRMTPQPNDWDLEKMLNEDEAKHWDHTLRGGDPFEEMLGSFTSDAQDEIEDWD